MCSTSFRVPLKRSISSLSQGVRVKEVIKSMKDLTIKAMCTCGKEMTEKDYIYQFIKEIIDAKFCRRTFLDV